MMKRVFAVLLPLIVCSLTCQASAGKEEGQQTPSKGVAANWPWHQKWILPNPSGPQDSGFAPLPSPPAPGGHDKPKPPSPIAKCLKDFYIERGCYHQIFVSFLTHKLNLDPQCCKVVSAISDDCVGTIFARFNNNFFGYILKKHCSSEGNH